MINIFYFASNYSPLLTDTLGLHPRLCHIGLKLIYFPGVSRTFYSPLGLMFRVYKTKVSLHLLLCYIGLKLVLYFPSVSRTYYYSPLGLMFRVLQYRSRGNLATILQYYNIYSIYILYYKIFLWIMYIIYWVVFVPYIHTERAY